ncbi:MAG TPA: YihY/virulence factor BrkB family protein [Flavipsychrobacter sp.]|nr:YihY/virulence factor BrkB family protein [Flavipsychrobacter sp.]
MSKLKSFFLRSPVVRSLSDRSKRTVLPGFQGLSVYEVGTFFFKELGNTNLNDRSAAATYNFLMAIPPTMLFLFSLVPYLPLKDVQETINYAIFLITPSRNVQQSITKVVDDFMNNERRGLLSFGIILTLFFSSNGMMGLMRTFDRELETLYIERSGLKRRWTALKLTLMLLIVAVVTLIALVIQSSALNNYILKIFDNTVVVRLVSLSILVTLIFCSISIVYKYGPSLTNKFRFVSPGSVAATILIVLATAFFFFLVDNFLNYNKIYGPIGTLLAFMIWIRIGTLIILIGYELNVSILLTKARIDSKIATQRNNKPLTNN